MESFAMDGRAIGNSAVGIVRRRFVLIFGGPDRIRLFRYGDQNFALPDMGIAVRLLSRRGGGAYSDLSDEEEDSESLSAVLLPVVCPPLGRESPLQHPRQ